MLRRVWRWFVADVKRSVYVPHRDEMKFDDDAELKFWDDFYQWQRAQER